MGLTSNLFRGDPRLERCLVSDPAHVTPGTVGDFVGKIQFALMVMGLGVISADEIAGKKYGPSTAAAVLAYKRVRKIINTNYQHEADNIVGKMTLERLDKEMADFEKRKPVPTPAPPPPVEPVSRRFSVRAAYDFGGGVMTEPPDGSDVTAITNGGIPQCYQVFDLDNNRKALYLMKSPGILAILIDPKFYPRSPRAFRLNTPLPLSGLRCRCVYVTTADSESHRNSRLQLTLGGQPVTVPMVLHTDAGLPSSGSVTSSVQGEFTFAKFGHNIFGPDPASEL